MQLLDAAGIFEASGRHQATGQIVHVVAPGDAVALGAPIYYFGEQTTVRFDTPEMGIVAADPMGRPIVLHRTIVP